MKISLERVHYMPKDLKPGVLYVSEEFDAVAHLCPCGCNSRVTTPLGPTEWSFEEEENGPSLYPSVGNWQLECQSHYWIRDGRIIWLEKWTVEEIREGRSAEIRRRQAYYDTPILKAGLLGRVWLWVKSVLGG